MLDINLTRFVLLPELRFLDSHREPQAMVIIAEKSEDKTEACPRCGQLSHSTYDHRTVKIKDEPLRRSQCILKIKKRRLYCHTCRKPFTEPVSGIMPKRRTTQRFRRAVLQAASSFTDLSHVQESFQCASSFIYKAVFEQLELKLREYQYPWPKVIGIDEHFFRRQKDSREYFTVFIDIKNHRPREAVLGKKLEVIEDKISHIEGREKVEWAVIDFSTTYRKVIRNHFPNAKIVGDKFHALRLFTKALRSVRNQIQLNDKQKLPPLRLMLKSRKDLDYFKRQELDRELKKFPVLDEVYRIKEQAMDFYRIKGVRRAEIAFEKLSARTEKSDLEPIKTLTKTLKEWKEAILNYFKTGLTNAMAEGFNRVASLVKNRAFGYRNPKNYRLRFLSACL